MKEKNVWFQKTSTVWLGAMLCCLLWGSAFPSIKIGYRLFAVGSGNTASQILFAGCRFTLAGVLIILFGSLLAKEFLYPRKQEWGKVSCLCMLQTVLQYFFFYVGLAHTSGVKASIIVALNVFLSILVAALLFHQESLTAKKMGGCLIGFMGVVLVNMAGMDFQFHLTGEGFMVLSTVASAFSAVFLKRFSQQHHPVMLSGYQFALGGVVMIIIGLAMGGRITVVKPLGLVLLVYMALISAVAYTLWGVLLKYNPVSRVAVFGFMNPVFGVILSALLLNEKDQAGGWISLISLVLVCIGIYVVNHEAKV